MHLWKVMIVGAGVALGAWSVAAAEGSAEPKDAVVVSAEAGEPSAAIELAPSARPAPDPCRMAEVAVVSSRPTWTGGAATIQCGVVQSDMGWLGQPMGEGVRQWLLPSSVSYGITPRLNLRWGLPGRIAQSGGASTPLNGISDQSISGLYRFQEQGSRMP